MNTLLKQKEAPACLWMQAGVVRKKRCHKDFICTDCRFDRAMTKICLANEALKRQGITREGPGGHFVFWKDRLKKRPLAQRPCIHHMKHHIGFKTCPQAYHCIDCEFDQYFHDQFKVHTVLHPVGFDDISGVTLPAGYYFHPGHTWIKIEDQGLVRMGIDDFACRLLGQFDRFAAPLMGKKLEQGRPAVTLSRRGHRVTFPSPVTGIITEVNDGIRKTPGRINQAPYTDGWVFMIHCPDLKQEMKSLMFMDACKNFMTGEVHRLTAFLEEETQMKAADGGSLVDDLFGNLPGVSWDCLVNKFIPQGP